MLSSTYKNTKSNKLKALRRLLGITLSSFAVLLFFQAIYLSELQVRYQNELMRSVSNSVLKELTQTLHNKRLKIDLFHNRYKAEFDYFYRYPDLVDIERYKVLLGKLREEFKDSRLFTLISVDGENLLEHITGEFLPDCKIEVAETVGEKAQKKLFLHRSKTSSHYDLIQLRNEEQLSEGFLFVAFNIDFIAELLDKYQLPYQQLFLLRNDFQGMIELSAGQSHTAKNDASAKTRFLSGKELDAFEHKLEIPNTRWSFAIRLDPKTKSEIFNAALAQAFSTWCIITILLYIAFQFIRRNLESKLKAEEQLDQTEKRAEAIINSVNEAVLSVDNQGIVTFANNRTASFFNQELKNVVGSTLKNTVNLFGQINGENQNIWEIIKNYSKGNSPEFANLTLLLDDGKQLSVAARLSPILDSKKSTIGHTITLEDLSTTIELSKRLVFHESRDSLTGLYNRRQLDKNLSNHLKKVKSSTTKKQKSSAIILIDLDKFQLLNTVHGFEAGDEFLKHIAILLRKTIPARYLLGRLSADEFITLVTEINAEETKELCADIKSAFRDFKFQWNEELISTSVCMGVVIIDDQFQNVDQLLAAADHACRLAKSKGSNITQFYQTDDPEIQKRTQEALRHSDIQKALSENRFSLYRQKIISLDKSSEVSKYEILVRMINEKGEIVPPNQIIPVAEKYGIMNKLDRWVISRSFENISTCSDILDTSYNINLSSQTLSDVSLIDYVQTLLDKYNISPSLINFEITETSAISYLENALDFMHAMKELGCTFSLDDFGTGLASFDYLKKLPIDFLKIDGVFVKDLAENPNDYAFIESIHRISNQMGVKTVAEFVENAETIKLLTDIGVDFAQGYHIHKPEVWLEYCS